MENYNLNNMQSMATHLGAFATDRTEEDRNEEFPEEEKIQEPFDER